MPKQFHLITFGINTVENPWFSPHTWGNKVMFNRRSVDFKTISVHSRVHAERFFVLRLWRHGSEWDNDVIADVNNGWGECIVPIRSEISAQNIRFDSGLILSYFLNYFTFQAENGSRMVARAMWMSEVYVLRVVPWLRPCRVFDQGTTVRASDRHNARTTIVNPFHKPCAYFV